MTQLYIIYKTHFIIIFNLKFLFSYLFTFGYTKPSCRQSFSVQRAGLPPAVACRLPTVVACPTGDQRLRPLQAELSGSVAAVLGALSTASVVVARRPSCSRDVQNPPRQNKTFVSCTGRWPAPPSLSPPGSPRNPL